MRSRGAKLSTQRPHGLLTCSRHFEQTCGTKELWLGSAVSEPREKLPPISPRGLHELVQRKNGLPLLRLVRSPMVLLAEGPRRVRALRPVLASLLASASTLREEAGPAEPVVAQVAVGAEQARAVRSVAERIPAPRDPARSDVAVLVPSADSASARRDVLAVLPVAAQPERIRVPILIPAVLPLLRLGAVEPCRFPLPAAMMMMMNFRPRPSDDPIVCVSETTKSRGPRPEGGTILRLFDRHGLWATLKPAQQSGRATHADTGHRALAPRRP